MDNNDTKKYYRRPRMNYEYVLPWGSMLLAEIDFDSKKRVPEVSSMVKWDMDYPVEDYMDLLDRYLESAAGIIDGYFHFDDDMTKEEEDTLKFYYDTFHDNLKDFALRYLTALRKDELFPEKEEDITPYLVQKLSVTNSFYATLSLSPHNATVFTVRIYIKDENFTADELVYALARFAVEIFPPEVLLERIVIGYLAHDDDAIDYDDEEE